MKTMQSLKQQMGNKQITSRTLAKSSMQLLCAIVLFVGLCAVATAPARARQLMDGMSSRQLIDGMTSRQLIDGLSTFKAYQIEFNNKIIGSVVVVGRDNLNPPPGYIAGREYWTWSPGAAWRGTFTLVPVNTVPDYSAYNWETFPHEHFDLARTVPMPAISPDAGDRFYRVQVQSGSRWINQGWMWLINGRAQEWYGQNLTSDLVGTGGAIQFTSAEPPAPDSLEVYLLIH